MSIGGDGELIRFTAYRDRRSQGSCFRIDGDYRVAVRCTCGTGDREVEKAVYGVIDHAVVGNADEGRERQWRRCSSPRGGSCDCEADVAGQRDARCWNRRGKLSGIDICSGDVNPVQGYRRLIRKTCAV